MAVPALDDHVVQLPVAHPDATELDGSLRGGVTGEAWGVELTSRYRIRDRFFASAGFPYTPVEDGLYLAASDTYTPVYGARNSVRYAVYQKVDAHIEKTFHTRLVQVTAYAELWWVPPVSNVMYLAYRYDYDERAPVAGPGFIPLVGIRAEGTDQMSPPVAYTSSRRACALPRARDSRRDGDKGVRPGGQAAGAPWLGG